MSARQELIELDGLYGKTLIRIKAINGIKCAPAMESPHHDEKYPKMIFSYGVCTAYQNFATEHERDLYYEYIKSLMGSPDND